jgi:hypothetical protein
MPALDLLLQRLAEKAPDVRADFVGHVAFNVADALDASALPPDMQRDLERFIDRAGFEEEDTDEQTRARIDAHFAEHAVDAELLQLFAQLEAALAESDAASAAEQGRAATAVLGTQASLKPVGAEGRAAGTLAGGLGGLLAAKTGKTLPDPAAAPAPKEPVTR